MKLSVAFLLITTAGLCGVPGQVQSKRQSNAPASKPRMETMKICQGVPIPDGYVIIAYMTSSVCSHGAYIIKKQADYESSSAARGDGRQPSQVSAQPPRTSPRTTSGSAKPANKSTQTPAEPNPSSSTVASTSRPRWVNAGEPQNEAPTLIGAQAAAPLRPPILGGVNATGSPVSSDTNNPATPAGPEEVGEGDVVRVDTTLVTVPVSVLDRQGRFVPNLKREDFSVFENGVEQAIAYFEPSDKPFTVALLLDTSASTHFHLSEIREAAIAFAKQLRPQDRVLVVSFNDEVLLLTEATNDVDTIETVIEEYANTGNSTRLYDAVDLVINERLNKIKGRKAIVLFTDGVDTSSRIATYQTTLRDAEELDALIYPIQYDTSEYMRAMQAAGGGTVTVTTRNWPFGTSTQTYTIPGNISTPIPGSTKADYERADHYLHALADKTGGRLYQANDTTQLADAFTRIAEELGRQYSIGYYPKSTAEPATDRRQIRVRVRQPDLAVKARDSYVKSAVTDPNK